MQFGPNLGRRLAALHHPAARDDQAGHARLGGLRGEPRRAQGIDRQDHAIGPLGQRIERREAGLAVDLGVVGVDEVAAGLAAHPLEIVAHCGGE
jgi:hypothetical protein